MKWCVISDEEKRVKPPLNMIWDVKRDHLAGDIDPLEDMPS